MTAFPPVVILAGGRGSRLGGTAATLPKALVPVGGRPLIEYVIATYRRAGCHSFVVVTGHLSEQIHQYFAARSGHDGLDIRCHFTGETTSNGGRLAAIADTIEAEECFLTWTDGLADIAIDRLLHYHRGHGLPITLTAVHPPPRFGHLDLTDDGRVANFVEKPPQREGWINGAYFVINRNVLTNLPADCHFERDILTPMSAAGQVMAYRHPGWWRCVDTQADIDYLDAAPDELDVLIHHG